jgi:NAD(P)-dependent dehydrogenase (short-subunit alcohol dehydrogenase family)
VPPDLVSVAGKRAVVTGGSRGIGLMIARGLLQAGADVLICSRKAQACEEAIGELSQWGPCAAMPADLSTTAGVGVLVDAATERFGATWGAPLEDYPEHAWDRALNTNLRGPFQLTVGLLALLRASATREDPARVVNVGSVDGISVPTTDNFAYSASKAAVHMMTRHLAKTLAPEAITVNAIAPGPFETRMIAYALEDPEQRDAIESGVPLGRIGSAEDVVGATIFLTSRAGAYLTGSVVPLDGGLVGCA